MANLRFPDFMEQAASYDAAEELWKTKLDAIAELYGFKCVSYINVFSSNGNKHRHGNPIFSSKVNATNRAVRIIQEKAEHPNDQFISAWLDSFAIDEAKPLQELVISLVLSEETLVVAENLISLWLGKNLNVDSMEQELNKLQKAVKP
jgi:DNA modification methylase